MRNWFKESPLEVITIILAVLGTILVVWAEFNIQDKQFARGQADIKWCTDHGGHPIMSTWNDDVMERCLFPPGGGK